MRKATVRVTNSLGLHARAAAQVVRLARTFESDIVLERSDTGAASNAGSILGLLALSASRGTQLSVTATGPDEDAASKTMVDLFEQNFGED